MKLEGRIMNTALIMMGGVGSRFGASIPKQFVEVDNRPVFTYLLEAYDKFPLVENIFIVCHPEWIDFTEEWAHRLSINKLKRVVGGGVNRSQSVQFGLEAIGELANDDDIVLIHDVTHPFLDKRNTAVCIEKAMQCGASTMVGTCFDTMYQVDSEGYINSVLPREFIVSATAPECFKFDVVFPLYKGKTAEELELMTSAGAMMVAHSQPVAIVRTPLLNLKITLHEDMEAFKKLIYGYYY